MKNKRPRSKASSHFMTVRSQISRIGTNPMFTGPWDEPVAGAYRAAVDANLGSLMNGVSAGHVSAIELLLDIVRAGIECVNKSALRHIGTYGRLAERRNVWPVLVTPHPDSFAAAQAFVQLIRLGTRTGVGYTNRKAFTLKDEREIVMWLYLELFAGQNVRERFAIPPIEPWDRLVSKLPALSRDKNIISAWWKPISLLFEARYGPGFETDRYFQRHWASPKFAPKGAADDCRRHAKQIGAAYIYADLMEWWLYGCYGRRKPRAVWRNQRPSVQAEIYPPMPKGSWQHAAVRLPRLSRRNSVIDEWFEAARLLNREPDSDYSGTFSNTEFARYMKNALGRTREIRKHIKDLLEQALTSIATGALESEVRGTLKR
jgi:hypothetical protein